MSSKKQFNRYEPPSPSVTGDEDRDESFLNDATKLYDVLPQPFRRIDKLLNEIFDLAWEDIEKRDQEKFHKGIFPEYLPNFLLSEEHELWLILGSSKVNIEKVIYEEELLIKDNVRCVALSGSFLFLGATNKITVYRLPEWKVVTVYEWCLKDQETEEEKVGQQGEEVAGDEPLDQSNVSVEQLHVVVSVGELAVLAAVDSDGVLRILAFQGETFTVIESLNTPAVDGATSTACVSEVSLSDDGAVLALTWRNTNTNTIWMDVFKVPTEMWIQELQHAMQQKDVEEEELSAAEDEKGSPDLHKLIHQFKLTPPEVKPSPYSLSSVMRNFDSDSPLTLTGTHHCLTANFFKHLSDEFKWKCNIPVDTDLMTPRQPPLPHVHFLRGQLLGSLFPSQSPVSDSGYNALAVWWEDHNILHFYQLKQNKDNPEPIATLPHAASIMVSSVNPQTNLVATYISNGCVTVWNRYLGHPVKVFHSPHPITMLHFSRVSGTSPEDRLTYLTNNGQLMQVGCLKTDLTSPVCLEDRSSPLVINDGLLCRVDGPNNLITLVWCNGEIIMYNELTSTALCQLEIFNEEMNNKSSSSKEGGVPLQVVYDEPYLMAMRPEGDDRCRLFMFDLTTSPLLQPFTNDLQQTSTTGEGEKMDRLKRYCENFVESCKRDEDELTKRVLAQYRHLLKT